MRENSSAPPIRLVGEDSPLAESSKKKTEASGTPDLGSAAKIPTPSSNDCLAQYFKFFRKQKKVN